MIERRTVAAALTVSLITVASYSAHADVRADEKTKFELAGMLGKVVNFFGGKSAREGVVQTVAVRGDRKASMNDTTGQIIDLSEEKVYDIDVKKKTYKVTTFAEIRRRVEEAQKKAQEQASKEQGKPEKTEKTSPSEPQVEVDFDIKNTGQKKAINGFDTHETILTVTVREKGKTLEQAGGMVMTADMWLAPTIKEMKEIRDFDVKYSQKLYGPAVAGASPEQMAAAMAMYPMMKQAMGKMSTEGGKVEGTPVLTVMTMDSVKSEEQVAAEASQSQSDDQKGPPPTSPGALLGSFAKRAAAKKASNDAPKARATVMTTTTEVLKVATNVAPDDVAVPAGFKEAK
jgi:hypothetical protein